MAGGCPLLLSYTTPGERLRGCSFAEGFKSYADLVQNSESITGSPTVADGVCTLNGTSWIDYRQQAFSKDFTVQFSFKAALADGTPISSNDATSGIRIQTVADGNINIFFVANGVVALSRSAQDIGVNPTWYNDGNWHTLFLSVSRTAGTYTYVVDGVVKVNAGALAATTGPVGVGSPLRIGATTVSGAYPYTGQIKDVKIWDTALDVAEAQAYYNGTMFNYMKRVAINLPCRAQDHDPVNALTRDVSGNNLHGYFAAAPDDPTKVSGSRGYTQDSFDRFITPVASIPAQTARTVFFCYSNKLHTNYRYLWALQENVPANISTIGYAASTTNDLALTNSSGTQVMELATAPREHGPMLVTVALSTMSALNSSWVFVRNFKNPLTGVTCGRTGNEVRFCSNTIGYIPTASAPGMEGIVYGAMVWWEQLNVTQIYDLHSRFLKQINDV